MNNGQAMNGGAGGVVTQVNPIQAAQFALMFLARADIKPAEREAYGIGEALLQAIVNGQVVLAPAAPAQRTDLAPPPAESPNEPA